MIDFQTYKDYASMNDILVNKKNKIYKEILLLILLFAKYNFLILNLQSYYWY